MCPLWTLLLFHEVTSGTIQCQHGAPEGGGLHLWRYYLTLYTRYSTGEVGVARRSLLVALVTPFVWEVPCAVNHHVAGLARGLLGNPPMIFCSPCREADPWSRKMAYRSYRWAGVFPFASTDLWPTWVSP